MTAATPREYRKNPSPCICVGCNKPIQTRSSSKDPGDRAVDIRIGTILPDPRIKKLPGRPRKNKSDDFRCEWKWGRMHLSCFLKAMESPDQFLVELGVL